MFHIGQKVVCVDTNIRPETRHPHMLDRIKIGNTYHIIRIGMNGTGVQIKEVEPAHVNNYFFSDRFRPLIRKTDILIFKELLKPVKYKDLCGND